MVTDELFIECPHLHNKPVQDGYHYNLANEPDTYLLWLCLACESSLRRQVLQQIIIESEVKRMPKDKKKGKPVKGSKVKEY